MFDIHLSPFAHRSSELFSCSPKSNILIGPNGSGKSKLLEAIFLLTNTLPPKERSFGDFVPEGGDMFHIQMRDTSMIIPRVCEISYQANAAYYLQGHKLSRAKYLEEQKYRSVFFTPLEMNILYLSPSLRRNFIDQTLLISHQSAAQVIKKFETALKSRNTLLKKIRDKGQSEDLLDDWDQIYVDAAWGLKMLRDRFFEHISLSSEYLQLLLGKTHHVSWHHSGDLDAHDNTQTFLKALGKERIHDIASGHTSIGPQHDDFGFVVHSHHGEIQSSDYLSRGENKTLLLALKSEQIRYIAASRPDKKIILLFDDIFAELDKEHIATLTSLYESYFTFFTTQHEFLVPEKLLHDGNIIYMNA